MCTEDYYYIEIIDAKMDFNPFVFFLPFANVVGEIKLELYIQHRTSLYRGV